MLATASGKPSGCAMATRLSRAASSDSPRLALFHDLRAPAHGRVEHLVRLFRGPAQPAGFPKDLDVEPVLPADGHR